MKLFSILAIVFIVTSCMKGEHVDLIVHNAKIYSMDNLSKVYEAMAIKDGKIIELGPERQILNKYSSDKELNAEGRDLYPGLIDAHGHIMSLARQRLSVELFGCKSMDDLLMRTEKYQSKKKTDFIVGRGWDQSLWGQKELPTNEELNKRFPEIPVCLIRVDGHAILANDAALQLAGINEKTKVPGGIVTLKEGKCTGLLVDNAMDLMNAVIKDFSEKELIEAISEIQRDLLQYGIVGVHEAGLTTADFQLMKKMDKQKLLSIQVYGMLMNSEENKKMILKEGKYFGNNFKVQSFKMYGDGALGSRGALLKNEYSDQHDHFGILTTPIGDMEEWVNFCINNDFQLNTHAIGDSTNAILLKMYKKAHDKNPDHRWRIEHAQVVDPVDFDYFEKYGIIPSVQPTHAVSDQRWAEDRIGKARLEGAYAYKTLLKKAGLLAIGTDFPVEQINPFLTIHAACARKDANNIPNGGFLSNEKLSLEECMRGMTYWAAISSFSENQT
ncbi:MAG: amidohydrolase, partial [Bacteroidetes bacterium]|nr:amidohydrolase [Bacteroidota bacterium]